MAVMMAVTKQAKVEPKAITGLWDTDRRGCSRWLPLDENSGDAPHGD